MRALWELKPGTTHGHVMLVKKLILIAQNEHWVSEFIDKSLTLIYITQTIFYEMLMKRFNLNNSPQCYKITNSSNLISCEHENQRDKHVKKMFDII